MSHQLHIDSLVYQLPSKLLLNGIVLSMQTSDIIGIIGRNGTGKSTLFSILFGLKKADSCFVRFDNTVIKQRKLNKIFSYAPQFVSLPTQFSLSTILPRQLINDFNLESKAKLKELSSGEQLLVQNIYTLILPQPFCILDEPFTGISPIIQEKLIQLIKSVSTNKGILIADHNHTLLQHTCTKLYTLDQGILKGVPSNSSAL